MKKILSILMLLPALASAQSADLFTPPASDKSVSDVLGFLFGDLVRQAGGTATGGDVFSSFFQIFNAAILMLGGVFLAYTLIAGTMATAHDGEVLGRRWSSMWVPLRTSLGIALITPIFGGYCALQVIVMWLVLQGVGIADAAWTAFASSQQSQTSITVQQISKQAAQVSKSRLNQLMCSHSVAYELATSKAAGYTGILYSEISEKVKGGTVYTTGRGFRDGVCGSYTFEEPMSAALLGQYDKAVFGDAETAAQASKMMNDAHKQALNQLSADLVPVVQDLAKVYQGQPTSQSVGTQYAAAVAKYEAFLAGKAQGLSSLTNASNTVAENASRDGWMMAGAWYMKNAVLQDQAFTAVNQFPTFQPPSFDDLGPLKESAQAFAMRSTIALGGLTDTKYGINEQYANDKAAREDGFSLSSLLHKVFSTGEMTAYFTNADSGKNPILWAQNFGHTVLNSVWSGLAVALGLLSPLGTNVLGTGYNAAPVVMLAMPFIFPIAVIALGFGAMAAFYLPLSPFIMWFGAFVGWVILVVEAVVAAPLWALAHLAPDADGVVGKGGQGYMLVLSLVLRPILMVFALIAAMTIIYPIGRVFNQVFASVVGLSNGNNLVGVFAFFATFAIYVSSMIAIIHKIFGLISYLPEAILKWLGGGHNSLLESTASDLNSGAAKGTNVIAAIGQKFEHKIPRNGGKPNGKPDGGGDVDPIAQKQAPRDAPQAKESPPVKAPIE